MGADETRSGSPERLVSPALEQEVMSALLDPSERTLEELDELLTRCAAEALRLRADRLRGESDGGRFDAERLRLLELTAEMRALRDRVEESSPQP